MPDHSNLDPRLVSSFPTVKTGPVWGRHNEKKKKDTVCVTVPFNIECAACHHRMNKGLKINGRKTLGPDMGTGHLELYHFACKGCKAVISFKRDDSADDDGYGIYKGALRNTGAGAIVKDGKRARVQSRRSDAASRLTPAAKPDDGDADDPAADGDAAAASAEDGIDEQAALEFLRDEEEVRKAFAGKPASAPAAAAAAAPARRGRKEEIDPKLLEYD